MRHEQTMFLSLRFLLSVVVCLVMSGLLGLVHPFPSFIEPAWAQTAAGVTIAAADDLEPAKVLPVPIDVNNTILRNYRQLPGFYPTLARILVQNAPYKSLEAMLEIPGLTEQQQTLIKANFVNFKVGAYQEGRYQLENRINQGYYG